MTGPRLLTQSEIMTVGTTQLETLGAEGFDADSKRYRYALIGGTSTYNAGLLLVAAAKTANSTGLAITAVGTGGQTAANLNALVNGGSGYLVVTNGSTSVTANQFLDGYLEVNWSGGPFKIRINGNTAAGNAGYITLSLAETLRNTAALVPGTDTVNITASVYAAPTTSTTQAAPVGVTVTQIVNTASVSNYAWLQVAGPAFVNATSATKGQAITQDIATNAGYVATDAANTTAVIGWAKETAASSLAPVELNLP